MPYSQYKADDSKLHEQERDVAKFYLDDECLIRLALLGIENQTAIDDDMPLRVIGYDGAAYRWQLNADKKQADGQEERKEKVKRYPVITVVLYFGDKPWKKPRCLYDRLVIPDRLRPFVNDYRINVIDVPRLTREQVELFKSDFKIVAEYFVMRQQKKDFVPTAEVIRHVDSFLKLIAVLTKDNRYNEIIATIPKGTEELAMCDFIDRMEARGEARGVEKIVVRMLKAKEDLKKIASFADLSVDQVVAIGKKAAVL